MKYFAKPKITDNYLSSDTYYEIDTKKWLGGKGIFITTEDGLSGFIGSGLVDVFVKVGSSYIKEYDYIPNYKGE